MEKINQEFLNVQEIKAQAAVIIYKCEKKLNEIRRKYHETKNVCNQR